MNLLIEKEDRVLRLTLNRPEKRNALNLALCRALVSEIQAAQADPFTGCILIDAIGPVFCAGMDLDEVNANGASELGDIHEELFTIGAGSLKPIVVTSNGAALGGGLGLVAQGHIVIAEASAMFGLPEIRIGLWPFLIYRAVERAIGARRTLALSISGRTFDAAEAQTWGLVQHVFPENEIRAQSRSIAQSFATRCPAAIAAGMQYARASGDLNSEQAGILALSLRDKVMAGPDFEEGRLAFKEKREPRWPSMPGISE